MTCSKRRIEKDSLALLAVEIAISKATASATNSKRLIGFIQDLTGWTRKEVLEASVRTDTPDDEALEILGAADYC